MTSSYDIIHTIIINIIIIDIIYIIFIVVVIIIIIMRRMGGDGELSFARRRQLPRNRNHRRVIARGLRRRNTVDEG